MSKGKLLFKDFLNKLGKAMQTSNWDDLTACWAARERLEAYLDPPRDEKGHWLAQQDTPEPLAKTKSSEIAKDTP